MISVSPIQWAADINDIEPLWIFPKTPLWTLGDKGSEFLSMNSFARLQGLRVGSDVENYVKLPLL
jgi:hypothetical protein